MLTVRTDDNPQFFHQLTLHSIPSQELIVFRSVPLHERRHFPGQCTEQIHNSWDCDPVHLSFKIRCLCEILLTRQR